MNYLKNIVNTAAFACAVVCLVITFLAAGFAACAGTSLPTRLLAQATVTDEISPYTHDELVETAVAIYDYSFASHDSEKLNTHLDNLENQAVQDGRMLPNVQGEQYRLDAAAIAHLDDCWGIAQVVRPLLIGFALLAVAACAHVGVRMRRRKLALVFTAAGAITLVGFAAVALALLIDFESFFAFFHSLFFTEGTWTFWYKSLLICSLPENFWMGMGALWVVCSLLLAAVSCFAGRRLRKTAGRGTVES